MNNLTRSKAPPGSGNTRLLPTSAQAIVFPTLIMLLCLPVSLPAQSPVLSSFAPYDNLDRPDHYIQVLAKIMKTNMHPGFGRWTAPLGDLNGDGYDDFAVSTLADTTFIFLGGDSLDPDPVFHVLGGAQGITAGDFNGNGLIDLITARGVLSLPEYDSSRGLIRIYFNTGGMPPFRNTPDHIIYGQPRTQTGWSQSKFVSGVVTADLNGDGISDLLYHSRNHLDTVSRGRLNLLLGGPDFPAHLSHQFLAHPRGIPATYAEFYLIGDLDGDGCDDLVIHGSDVDSVSNRRVDQMDVFLGNRDGIFGAPDIVHRDDSAWVTSKFGSNICDVDGDGCAELIDASVMELYGAVRMYRGSPLLPYVPIIWPNDSIPNQYPSFYIAPRGIYPVGDMNGDGYNDFIIGFHTKVERTGTVYLLYPAGPYSDWKTATGRVGILPETQNLAVGAFPIGDVNGDGYDDMVLKGYPTFLEGHLVPPWNERVVIYSGSPRMRTGMQVLPAPASGELDVWPRPLQSGEVLNVRVPGAKADGVLRLYDLFGRQLLSTEVDDALLPPATLPTGGLSPGVYLLRFETQTRPPRSTVITVLR